MAKGPQERSGDSVQGVGGARLRPPSRVERQGISPQGPASEPAFDEGEGLSVGAPKAWVAGIPAVLSTFRHIAGKAGMRGVKALRVLNQVDGFDCPSCAWPDADDERSAFEFCENGAKAVASETMKAKVDGAFFARYSVAELAAQSDAWHDAQGRIAEPVLLDEGASHYRPIRWEEAFALLGEHLRALPSPHRAAFYTSGRASNEAAFLYGLLARSFGTQNLPDCSNMCHESSGAALGAAIGIGKGTVSLEDFEAADVVLCAGQNPGTNHPRMLATLEAAVEVGAKLVSINPLREPGLMAFAHPQKVRGVLGRATALASAHLPVAIGGDQALFRGLAKALLAREESQGGVFDQAFLAEYTRGLADYLDSVRRTPWSQVEALSGLGRETIEDLAETITNARSGKKRLITCWAMGLTQHHHAVPTLREVANVHLLLGAVGREGAGFCPVRGHSNVQGDRTVGIGEKMPEWFQAALEKATGIEAPRAHGHDAVGTIFAMHRGEVDVFVALGGNFLQASPDTAMVAEGLRQVGLTVQISTKLNRSHLVTGRRALILPCLGRTERDEGPTGPRRVSCENSMGVVQGSAGRLAPASAHLRSEVDIVRGIALATLSPEQMGTVDWSALGDYDRVRTLIEAVVPGFDDYNQRVREPGGFYLPNGPKERVFPTASGKAEFHAGEIEAFTVQPGRFVLQTLRSHDQFNTTIYGEDDRYRGVYGGRRVVFMNPEDMRERGFEALQPVDLISHFQGETRRVRRFRVIPYEMPRGALAAYFPEANPLVPAGSFARVSRTPTSKAIEVSVRAS